jgi:hypothetical protein
LGIFGGGQAAYPPMSPPAPPPAPDRTPSMADPWVREAREAQKKRAAAMAGYASTIATGGLGLTDPASTTGLRGPSAPLRAGKTMLGA